MSRILLLSGPAPQDVDPILNLATNLVNEGEQVTFFGTNEVKQSVEDLGAEFKPYNESLDVFGTKAEESSKSGLITALLEPMKFIDDIVVQIRGLKFDYAVFSSAYPYANIITQLLGIPKAQYGLPD